MSDPWGLEGRNGGHHRSLDGNRSGPDRRLPRLRRDRPQHQPLPGQAPDDIAELPNLRRRSLSPVETEALIDTLKADHERIDVLINNTRTRVAAPSVDYPMDDWDRLIELNLTAPFLLSRGLAADVAGVQARSSSRPPCGRSSVAAACRPTP